MDPYIQTTIALYVLTNCVSVLMRQGDRQEPMFVRVCAGVTILAAMMAVQDAFF